MRVLRRSSLFVVLFVAAAALLAVPSDLPIPRLPILPAGPTTVVSLGDSTLSGEGIGNYLPGTRGENGDWCHVSPTAEIDDVAAPGITQRVNLACSGADAARVGFGPPDSQARRLTDIARRDRVGAVVVAVGANDDPRFSDVVSRCTEAWLRRGPDGCSAEVGPVWRDHVTAMVPKVAAALRDVHTAMHDAGYPPDTYSVVLQSYAAPVGPDMQPSLQNLNGCPFRTADLTWVQDTAVPELSAGLRAAAQESGARFLDLSRAGVGHEACSGAPSGEWFTRLTVDFNLLRSDATAGHAMQESFHPNGAGHAAFAGCLSAFLSDNAAAAACLPDGTGRLRPVPGRAVEALAAR